MRFMVLVKASKDSEAGVLPTKEQLAEMGAFNAEMMKAGVMLDGDGLQATSKGARIRYAGDQRTVIDGPFAETKEIVAGFWMIQTKSLAEAIEWIKRAPFREGEVEIRQVFEAEDFGPEFAGEPSATEKAMRDLASRR